jgi:Glycosyl hydrolases family 43
MTTPVSQVDVVGDTPSEVAPAPRATRTERRQDRDRSKRKRRGWTAAVVVVLAIAAGVTVAVLPSSSSRVAPAARVARVVLPPPAPVDAPATIFSQLQLVSDPAVLVDGKHTYLYGTGGGGVGGTPHVPVRIMNDTTTLPQPTDAMPMLPTWSWGWIWAPDVIKASDGQYVMWFTTRDVNRNNPDGVNSQCIGTATSDSALGPFAPGPAPVICQTWGSIDPRSFTAADGSQWMIWKSDSNADKSEVIPTTIWSQRLGADGTTLVGQPIQIATASQPWEQNLIEAPDLVQSGSKYYLFFSGGPSNAPQAAIGYQTCKGPQGPCSDSRTTPFVASNSQGQGPSEESLFTRNGVTWLLYTPTAIYQPFQYPYTAVARVAFGPKGPYVAQFAGAMPGRA